MVQLWVNLPAKDKRAAAGYQTLLASDIPVVALEGEAGSLRVIAGATSSTRARPAPSPTWMCGTCA
jgi:redox-sensitive bicupin YhaK (pirin superfamily)